MKKYLLAAALAFCAFSSVDAQKPIEIKPGELTNAKDDNQHPRSPVLLPEAYLDDHLLTFDFSCIGSAVEILLGDTVVYTAIVDENGEVELPDYLIGIYELQLHRGSITFVGEIEL